MTKCKDKGLIFSLIFTVLLMIPCIILAWNGNLWLDEIITVEHCEKGLKEIADWAARDVHPPLYYYLLYGAMVVSGHSVIAMKLLSVVAHFGLLLCGVFFIRNKFGYKAMVFYELFMTSMPYMFYYSVEVRMYEWAMFFVVLCAIATYYVVTRGCKRDWVMLCVTALFSAYTHYYALLCAVMLYALLFFWLFVNKEKRNIKNYIITAVITIAGYLPWVPVLFGQTAKVANDFWISGKGIMYYISQLFDCGIPYSLYINILILGILFVFLLWNCRKMEINVRFWTIGCVLVFPIIFVAVYLFSILVSPIIVIRYLMIMLVLLAIGMAVASQYVPKVIFAGIVCFYLLSGVVLYKNEFEAQNVDAKGTIQILEENAQDGFYTDIANLDYYLRFYDCDLQCVYEELPQEGLETGEERIVVSTKSIDKLELGTDCEVEQISNFEMKTVNGFIYRLSR